MIQTPSFNLSKEMNVKYPEPKNVRTYSQHQMQMFPPSVRSLIEDDHLCLVVDDVVKVLDLGVRLTLRLQFGKMLLNKISPEFFPAIAQYDRTEGQHSLPTIDAPTHA